MSFNPLNYPICFEKPQRLTDITSWHEHIPFAFTIVQMLKPKIFVELGTHKGDSYCAFCQAVNVLGLDTACYAVDTWEGDEHSGLYGPEILEELKTYHDSRYKGFSQLIQSRFEEALDYFLDSSIDLIHIDGCHTYDAIKYDFERWLPKMSQHGVVLFHDINVHEREFGVWKFWEEVAEYYPCFEFKHGHGLGVLAVGTEVIEEVLAFLNMGEQEVVITIKFYSYLGDKIALGHQLQRKSAQFTEVKSTLQVRDTQITEFNTTLQTRDTQITELTTTLQTKDTQITELTNTLQTKDTQITKLNNVLQAKDTQITELNDALQSRDAQITEINSALQTRDTQITELTNTLQAQDAQIRNLYETLQTIYMSATWRMVMKYHRGMEWLLPFGTRRRRYYDLAFTGFRIIANEGGRSFLMKFKNKNRLLIEKFVKNRHLNNKSNAKIFECHDVEKEIVQTNNDDLLTYGYQPKISIIMPVYNTEQCWLTKAIDSVYNQIYDNWELCIINDASTQKHIEEILNSYTKKDKRIKVKHIEENKGISGASNEALSLVTSEFVTFLDHDDELTKDALYEIVKLLNEHRDADIIYSDDDKIDGKGNRYDFQFKPDWSPELLLSYCYFSHIKVLRRTLIEEIGGFREGYEGAQDYDLVLRAVEKTDKIYHIPKILYHWRSILGSIAYSASEKPTSIEKGRKAVEDAISRREISGKVIVPEYAQKNRLGIYKINFELKSKPKISIIIPTKDRVELLKRCISSIESKTTYDNYEIFIIDAGSEEKETLKYFNETKHKVLSVILDKFNFSKINNFAVSKIDSEFVLLLNNDTEIISQNWLEEMLGYMLSDFSIGAVGAKLIYKDGRIQHAGVVLGLNNGLAGHANKLIHHTNGGYLNYALVVRNYSAITGACLLTRKKYYEEVGGLDEENFSVAYNDIDFCLKLIKKGYRIVFNPYALLYHDEGGSRGTGIGNDDPAEEEFFRKKWGHLMEKGDPHYNTNLSLDNEIFNIKKYAVENELDYPKKKNLLFITNDLNFGGAPFSQFHLAKRLKNKGYNITVLSPWDGPLRNYYLDISINVNILRTSLNNKKGRDALISWTVSKGFEFAHINTIINYPFIDTISAAGVSTIWGIHESERDYYVSTLKIGIKNYFKIADRVVFVSNATKKIYSDLEYNGNFHTIYNGIDIKEIEQFKQNNNKFNLRKKHGFAENCKIITIVGTTCERKGQKIFVLAALKLLKESDNNDIHFIITSAREGEYLETLRNMIQKNNSFANIHLISETRDIFDYYFISDIFVCASFIESLPLVVLEAMAFELPIIATNVYGIPEEIEDGKSGILIEPGDVELLVSKINFLLENDEVANKYSKEGHNRVKSMFSLEKMVDEYEKLFVKASK